MMTSNPAPLRTLLAIHVVGVCACVSASAQSKGVHIAHPDTYPYADANGGREGYALSSAPVNEARLYDFYQRQADYYMATGASGVPSILPAYPGLDGGSHGHWGKHNQNNYSDARWNDADMGEVITQVLRHGKEMTVLKGICLRLGENQELSACFDPLTLSYRSIWEGGFVRFDGFRWGTSRNAQVDGAAWFTTASATMPEGGKYLGFHRYGKRIVFDYQIDGTMIRDETWALGSAFLRRIDIQKAVDLLEIDLPRTSEIKVIRQQGIEDAAIDQRSGKLRLEGVEKGAKVMIAHSNGGAFEEFDRAIALLEAPRAYERRWTESITVAGTLGKPRSDSAYVVDTLTVPYDNPYKVVMQLSGLAFLSTGEALVSTLQVDIWKVSGIDASLQKVTWRRFATGLNQPIGIHIDADGIFVLDRGQIYRLHDINEDGEVDYYENYANDFGGYDRSHTHTFGLHRTEDGAFHFTQRENILRTGTDRQTAFQGWGVRNCMGIGGSRHYAWVAPQEGTWTPASAIIEVHPGEFYGLPSKDGKAAEIAAPLCFIPRGVDNSTGGMVEITSDRWGPFAGAHVGLSYGSGLHYLILRDDKGVRPQGAVVPLEGEFLAGSMRGAFHPMDGQLYLVGLDGWGDYSLKDGCFHRARYMGGQVYKPCGFQVHQNGIRIDFPTALDPQVVEETGNYFAHAWNYEFARRYGSPEFSIKEPASLGHDPIEIRSVTLLDDQQSIFVEMPLLEPVMQVHIRMHVQAADGHAFKTDLFASPMYPSAAFKGEGLVAPIKGKPTSITLRVTHPDADAKGKSVSGNVAEGGREIVVDAVGGLQFAQSLIEVHAGEALAWTLRNQDVMPHNLVLVSPKSAKKVGEASFAMVTDPNSGKRHYVPDLDEVITFIPVINPGKEHILYFQAPKVPGDYPYICTFPGHWMAMQGILRVQ